MLRFEEVHGLGAYLIHPQKAADHRGSFSRLYCKQELAQIGVVKDLAQINLSVTRRKGTIRGMHFQTGTSSECKIVKCLHGRLHDVIVDIRADSKSFLSWAAVTLSAQEQTMLYVPEGFAHGFQALEDDTQLMYMVTESYCPEREEGLHHADPRLSIAWPLPVTDLSDKDAALPFLQPEYAGLAQPS